MPLFVIIDPLVDTNVISEGRKANASPNVRASSVSGSDVATSVLVIGEIRRGIERLRIRDAAQAAVYERWLTILRQEYAGRILPITLDVAEEWGRLNVQRTLSAVDGLLAATAKVLGLTLVTRNIGDTASTGVSFLNPFE